MIFLSFNFSLDLHYNYLSNETLIIMIMKNFICFIAASTLLSLIIISCGEKCEECPNQSTDKIIVDEVDTAIVKKANYIIVDEVDTAYVKNTKYVIIENTDNAYVENSKKMILSGNVNAIIVDEVDTAIVVPATPENPLKEVVEEVRNDDEEDNNDKKKEKQN